MSASSAAGVGRTDEAARLGGSFFSSLRISRRHCLIRLLKRALLAEELVLAGRSVGRVTPQSHRLWSRVQQHSSQPRRSFPLPYVLLQVAGCSHLRTPSLPLFLTASTACPARSLPVVTHWCVSGLDHVLGILASPEPTAWGRCRAAFRCRKLIPTLRKRQHGMLVFNRDFLPCSFTGTVKLPPAK